MQINKLSNSNQSFFGKPLSSFLLKNKNNSKQYKYMQEACYKLGDMLGQPASRLTKITKNANIEQFNFLRTMANKYHKQNFYGIKEDSDHILNIYSMVEKPLPAHMNIVYRNTDSFESLEKIFSLARDERSLEFVESLQHDILKDSSCPSKIIIDLLSSKNRIMYINKPQNYTSYLKLHADNKDAIKNLDELIETGRYSKTRSDAQYAISKLMKKKTIGVAMAGKTSNLQEAYTQERGSFLKAFVENFMPKKRTPKEITQNVVVEMYSTVNHENAKLRQGIMEMFKRPSADKTAEINEMKILFDKIDTNEDVKKFVQMALDKDLKIGSVAELNEVLETTPLKKANIFFNNAKKIIETSSGEERKTALVTELENPFFIPKTSQKGKAKMVRMFDNRQQPEGFFSRAVKLIENKINQYRYNKMVA